MTADTDHARALEVLQGGFLGEFKTVMLNGKLALVDRGGDAEMGNYVIARDVSWPGQGNLLCAFPALVALYAAAVELRAATEAHVAAATKNEQEWKHIEVHETRKRQHAAHLAFVEALAAVPKAVLP